MKIVHVVCLYLAIAAAAAVVLPAEVEDVDMIDEESEEEPVVIMEGNKRAASVDDRWEVRKDNSLCLMAHISIRMELHWMSEDKSMKKTSFTLDSKSAKVDVNASKCSSTENLLVVAMNYPGVNDTELISDEPNDLQVQLLFTKDPPKHFRLSHVDSFVHIDSHHFPHINDSLLNTTQHQSASIDEKTRKNAIRAAVNNSFQCNRANITILDKTDAQQQQFRVRLVLQNSMQVQAFITTNSTEWGPAEHCQADYVSNVVLTLAIGGGLAALVVVVVATFFIGRKYVRTGFSEMRE